MNKLTNEELRSIQIEVLQDFHDFCIKNDLKYSLCAGTLLGAIRHKGYIPWDDDIDVMMPRKDYQRFLSMFNSEKTTLWHFTKQKPYIMSFAKLCDNRTLLKEGIVYECGYGVDIDIFPLDFFPDTMEESRKWIKHIGFYKKLQTIKNLKVMKSRSLIKNVVIVLLRTLAFPIPMKMITKKIDELAQKYSYKTDGYLGNVNIGYGIKERNPMAKALIDVDFEGRKFKAIDNYDVYLTGLYGDYMTPPPVNMRTAHHAISAFWK